MPVHYAVIGMIGTLLVPLAIYWVWAIRRLAHLSPLENSVPEGRTGSLLVINIGAAIYLMVGCGWVASDYSSNAVMALSGLLFLGVAVAGGWVWWYVTRPYRALMSEYQCSQGVIIQIVRLHLRYGQGTRLQLQLFGDDRIRVVWVQDESDQSHIFLMTSCQDAVTSLAACVGLAPDRLGTKGLTFNRETQGLWAVTQQPMQEPEKI